jgi:hypothetical protein
MRRILVGLAGALALWTAAAVGADADTALPAGAKGFAGMIAGEVTSAGDNQLVLSVGEILRTWKHSTAEDAKSMVGRKVQVRGRGDGGHATAVAKFIAGLKVGDRIGIDVRNAEGDVLILVELTEEQRQKVGQK